MNKIINTLFNICQIEALARRDIWINRIHPLAKIVITFVYIVCVSSIDKYNLPMVIIAGIYPLLTITLGRIPFGEMAKKMIVPMFMGAGLGIFNPILDTRFFYLTDTVAISAGWISFLSLILKSICLITAALLLVSTTPIEDIAYGLNCMKVPKIMTLQLLLMFRYITILVNEIERVLTAYSMRSCGKTAIAYKSWGPLIGQFFLRTSQRALRLYEAMKLRGFSGEFVYSKKKFAMRDGIYLSLWTLLFAGFMGIRG